jgi:RimJ/RimL family protein N-acetyltransferase
MLKLVEIKNGAGNLPATHEADDLLRSVVEAMIGVYQNSGFVRPWIGYVAIKDDVVVGTCAFKSPPTDGRVEIAYFTFPDNEGLGIATGMASELIRIARHEDAGLIVFAQTLPEENASTTILKKLGFQFSGAVQHPEDGTVWEWELRPHIRAD